jgi:hypothetical protein
MFGDLTVLISQLIDKIVNNPSSTLDSLSSLCLEVIDLPNIDDDPKRVIYSLLDRLKTDYVPPMQFAVSYCIINQLSSRYPNTFTLLNDRDVLLILKDSLVAHIPSLNDSCELVFDTNLALFYQLLYHEDLDLMFLSRLDGLFFTALLEYIETMNDSRAYENRLFALIRLLVLSLSLILARIKRTIHEQEYIQKRSSAKPSDNFAILNTTE